MPTRTADEWVREYEERGVYWVHKGESKRPHALLTSGLHSSGFFYSGPVITDEKLLDDVAHDLVEKLDAWFSQGISMIDRVVGPATGATELAKRVAEEITRRRGWTCHWASPQKVGEGSKKTMVFDDPALGKPKSGEVVWRVEDVLTTGGSVEKTGKAVVACGATLISSVGVIVNRSGLERVGTAVILPLVYKPMPTWTPDECPLCKGGESEAIRPKTPPENWARLNAEY